MAGDAVTLEKDGTIQVTWTGADNDWNYVTDTPEYSGLGYLCSSIVFYSPDVNDELVVNEGSNDGPSPIHLKIPSTNDNAVHYFPEPKWIRPYIDYSDCAFTQPTKVKAIFTIV